MLLKAVRFGRFGCRASIRFQLQLLSRTTLEKKAAAAVCSNVNVSESFTSKGIHTHKTGGFQYQTPRA